MKNLYNEIEYTKTMMLTGFLKSTIGTGLISLGILIIFMSMSQPQAYSVKAPWIGLLVLVLGCIAYFLGDVYKMIQKKKELNTIEVRTHEIVQQIYTEANAERDKKVEDRLKEFEDAICTNTDVLCSKQSKK